MVAVRPHGRVLTLGVLTMTLLTLPIAARGQCQPVWSIVGDKTLDDGVRALAVFDDGTGPALYAGGWFRKLDEEVVNYIARWDGQEWSSVDGGVTGKLGDYGPRIDCLKVLDLGDGPALYVGGDFQFAGSVEVNGIAKWDGIAWSAVTSGLLPSDDDYLYVYDLCVYDDGMGPALYAGGWFKTPGPEAVEGLARWDGANWSAVGGGLSPYELFPSSPCCR